MSHRPSSARSAVLLLVPVAVAASGLVAVSSATSTSSAAEGPAATCLGERATVVGRPGSTTVRGTPGPDVIVTNGAIEVLAGGGADRVCVTRSVGRRVVVEAAGGADRVVVRGRANVTALLGPGSDGYRGGPGRDTVYGTGGARDLVVTGDGFDSVYAGRSDVVRLGAGDDEYTLFAQTMAPGGRVTGGPGRDGLTARPELRGDVVLDAGKGTGTTDGVASFRFDGMETYYVDTGARGSVDFRGSARPEELRTARSRVVTARMGGGDDTAGGVLFSDSDTEHQGGSGDDVLGFFLEEDLVVDLATGTVGLPAPPVAAYSGFESYEPRGYQVTVTGSDAPDTVTAFGCRLSVRGGAGGDTLRLFAPVDDVCSGESEPSELYGEGDDDVLIGNRLDDVLDGGAGDDQADGREGTDVCVAERRVRCES